MTLDDAKNQLEAYGLTIVGNEIHNRKGLPSGVLIKIKRNRFYLSSKATEFVLFSGDKLPKFLESFWLLKPDPNKPYPLYVKQN